MIESLGEWKRTHYSKELNTKMDGNTVITMGWVRALRGGGKIKFIQLADRMGTVQVTAKADNVDAELMKIIDSLGREYVIAVKGTVKPNKEAPDGLEIIPQDIRILNIAESPLPLEVVTKKTPAELPTRLDSRFMDLRKPEIAAIFDIKDAVTSSVRNFFEKNGFIEIHTPKLLAEASEGGAEVFKVKYFDRNAYLAQSPQFYKQIMMSTGFDKVYEIAPAFRAEKSRTSRHVAEIIMLDIELAFINSVEDVMGITEKMMAEIVEFVSKTEKKSLEILKKEIQIPKLPFPRITMEEAKELLKKRGLRYSPDAELDTAGERTLGEIIKEKFGHDFVFLTDFPWKEAKFYHMKNENNPKVTHRCDLIYKGVETATISLREHRYQVLMKQAKEMGVDPKKIEFYLNSFRYGMPPHGGAGIGIDRIVQQMLELPNIQEAVLFPRTPDRLSP